MGYQDNFMELLPSELQDIPATQVLQRAKQLQASQLFKFNGEAGQRAISAATDIINQIACGQPPSLSPDCTPFLARVKHALRFFVRHAHASGEVVVGSDALMIMWQKVQAKKEPLDFQDIEVFHTFQWLLPAAEQKKFTALAKNLVQVSGKAAGNTSSSSRKGSAGGASGSKEAARKAASSTDLEAAMSVFN